MSSFVLIPLRKLGEFIVDGVKALVSFALLVGIFMIITGTLYSALFVANKAYTTTESFVIYCATEGGCTPLNNHVIPSTSKIFFPRLASYDWENEKDCERGQSFWPPNDRLALHGQGTEFG